MFSIKPKKLKKKISTNSPIQKNKLYKETNNLREKFFRHFFSKNSSNLICTKNPFQMLQKQNFKLLDFPPITFVLFTVIGLKLFQLSDKVTKHISGKL